MRQKLEIILMTSVDTDTWIFDQKKNEEKLREAIEHAIVEIVGGDRGIDYLEFEYLEMI